MASELLKVARANAASNSEVKLIDGSSGHTYVILSITICETAGNAETFDLYTMDDGGSTDNFIYKSQPLAANATFEHTSKLVIEATDELGFVTGGAADVDVTVTYLDQTL
tara:strand:- start:59 stop:388 length:330 start_codon:yes stop_codon:yes gene_type:complete